jgi:methylglutaconyl-CoA hydratase
MPPLLTTTTDPAITTLTLNRPDRRNALNIELLDSLHTAITTPAPTTRVLILNAAGPAFCAGLDFHEAADPALAHRSAQALADVYRALCTSPLLTVAAAHGAAMGGGAGLLAACDFAFAADDLSLAYPEVRRGLVAALVTCLLRRQLADRQIREIILVGQTLPAAQAKARGLVTQVVPANKLQSATLAFAQQARQGAPGAIARTKQLLEQLNPITPALEAALKFHLEARNSEEAAEGIQAFLEKRPPRWSH